MLNRHFCLVMAKQWRIDGLTLFGPLDEGKPYGIRAGVIGTKDGIQRFKKWVEHIQDPISNDPPQVARPPFPGFEAAFRIPWNPQPTLEIQIPESELKRCLFLNDKHQRVYNTVELYSSKIIQAIREEDLKVDTWFVIVPDEVHKYCRPKSYVEPSPQIQAGSKMPIKYARKLQSEPSLFTKDNIAAIPYHYEVNFHNQLKAESW